MAGCCRLDTVMIVLAEITHDDMSDENTKSLTRDCCSF